MIRRPQRELNHLYELTHQISQPKITPVLEGVYPIQGPIEESDFELKNINLVDLIKKKQPSESEIPRTEKGTCSVCSTPCVSCYHLKDPSQSFSESKSEPDQVIKEEEICLSVSQVGNNNMSGCNLKCDAKDESSEEKVGVDGKNMKGKVQSGSAKSSIVSEEVEEKMTPGHEADKMASDHEDDARKIDMNEKSENGKNLSSSGDGKEKNSEEEETDEIEDDVKVCDICGDVGQEDLLAFCTRCSDGAEHTYCMRVMMDDIPEGEWLCEECQIEVQAEKQKEKQKAVAKSDERREKKPPRRLNSYFQRKEQNQEESKKLEPAFEKKIEAKVAPKKPEPNAEPPELKKTELVDMKKKLPADAKKMERAEIKKPESLDTNKTESVDTKKNSSATTHENSVLESEMDKGKLGTLLPRGTLSKSSSFKAPSSKIPKVKQITEVPQNLKISKDTVANNLRKETTDRIISRPSSFKNPNQSATTETLKKPPPKEPRDRNVMNSNNNNNKGTSILGRPGSGILSSPKIDSSGASISQGLENGLPSGRNEIKKANAAKAPSGSSLPPRADDISTCFLLDSILQRNVPLATPRIPRCQRCNETGHAIQSCPKDPTRLAALKPPDRTNHNHAKESLLKRPKFTDHKDHENSMLRMDTNGFKIEPAKICSLVPVVFDQFKSTIIPEVEYIWQGGFELVREGKPSDRYDGFQAHFSSRVSPKVAEIVKRFPFLVRLEEVPRQKTWPVQFEEVGGPTENHIGIYFFARDCESYESCYMKLVESMRNNDLALRGKIGTAELLVFPSNLLPECSQRWNKLYYLWGIFKGTGSKHSKEGSASTSGLDCNHYENMAKTATENCLKDEHDVKAAAAAAVQEKDAEHASVSPKLVDLNSCEITEEAEADVVDEPKEKEIITHTTDLDFKKDEEISCVRSSHVELSKNTSLRPEFRHSASLKSPSLMQGGSIDLGASRKRSSSTEPVSSLDQLGVDSEREHKKVRRIDNGDPTFASSGFSASSTAQNRGNLSTITSTDEMMIHRNINLESPPPMENGTPDLELALGDTKRSPKTKKGPMLPFLSPPKVNLQQGDGSSSTSSISSRPRPVQVQVRDETACLSLSLGFPVVASADRKSGDDGSNRSSSATTHLFPFNRPRDS